MKIRQSGKGPPGSTEGIISKEMEKFREDPFSGRKCGTRRLSISFA
jgi:hypothetical protein